MLFSRLYMNFTSKNTLRLPVFSKNDTVITMDYLKSRNLHSFRTSDGGCVPREKRLKYYHISPLFSLSRRSFGETVQNALFSDTPY